MFGILKKKTVPQPATVERTPRSILPTYVTDAMVVLSKAAPTIRNTYEIRLALFMAKSRELRFLLAIRPGARVEASVRKLLEEHGGTIEEAQLDDYCVYIGWGFEEGEQEGWALGDAATFNALTGAFESSNLKTLFRVGASISGPDLDAVTADLAKEQVSARNVDGENVREALLTLAADAKKEGGTLFVQ